MRIEEACRARVCESTVYRKNVSRDTHSNNSLSTINNGCLMKLTTHSLWLSIFALTVSLLFPVRINAHPGSGIVVDRHGNIYFVDTGGGVFKIDRNGRLSRLQGPAYHWMAIDIDGRLTNVTLPYFSSGDATVTRVGADPALLLSSDFPIVVGRDGSLYYPWRASQSSGDRLQVFRLARPAKPFGQAPSGKTSVFVTLPDSSEGGPLRWLNGIAVGLDSSIYFSENNAVRKISSHGQLSTVADNISLTGCASIPGVDVPYLRGLDVDASGNVYVAASGCGSVLKITTDGRVTSILSSTSPWSPTGVAVSGNDLYVLEYLHTEGDNRRDWLPRVRKLSPDGRVSTIAEIKQR